VGSGRKEIRAADAKEVGVENPAEETFCYPNQIYVSETFRLAAVPIVPAGPR